MGLFKSIFKSVTTPLSILKSQAPQPAAAAVQQVVPTVAPNPVADANAEAELRKKQLGYGAQQGLGRGSDAGAQVRSSLLG